MNAHSLRQLLAPCFLSFALALTGRAALEKPLLVPGPGIELAGSKGKFDFLQVDEARHRLLASHEVDGTADFFDLDTQRLLARVKLGTVVDIVPDPQVNRYFASVQGEQIVAVIDATRFEVTATIKLDGELDAILFNPKNRRVYVAHDNGTHLWGIDADTAKVVATIEIPGAPECMVYDKTADRIYLAIKTTSEIVVINPNTDKVEAHWPTAPTKGPHGVAFDPASGRLFAAGDNGQLAVFDTKTGKLIDTVTGIALKVDQIAFDPSTKRVYCAAADWMSVVQETAEGAVFLGNVKTAATARNVAIDPKTHAVWTTFTDGTNAYAKSWLLP